MKDAIERYLQKNIDQFISVIPLNGSRLVPLFFLEFYRLYETNVLGNEIILLEIINDIPALEALKKHLDIIKQYTKKHIVICARNISTFRRRTFIENRIPFIVENGQIFLPFISLDIKKTVFIPEKKNTYFSVSTQVAFLYFLYHNKLVLSNEALSKLLRLSTMSASRALNDLYQLGLLRFDKTGKTNRIKDYYRIEDPNYYRMGSEFLKKPVWKSVFTKIEPKNVVSAGIEALSLISMLNPPNHPIKAIYKKRIHEIQNEIVTEKDQFSDGNLIEIELWNYDPMIFDCQKRVDLVSLALSLEKLKDERVEQALKEVLKKEKWYTD